MLADGAATLQIVDQRGRSARQRPPVLIGVITLRRVEQTDTLLMEAARTHVAVQAAGALELVVAHQGHLALAEVETAHAVRLAGDEQAVVHGVAALGDDLVGEPLGQVEQAVGVHNQRTVAVDLVDIGLLGGGRLGLDAAGQAGEGDGGGRTGEKITTLQAHGRLRGTQDLWPHRRRRSSGFCDEGGSGRLGRSGAALARPAVAF